MIRVIVHGGYVKTATTFLQDKIFSQLSDVSYLGKLHGGKMISPEFKRCYQSIFPSLSASKSTVRARNSAPLISCLGDILLNQIKQTKKEILLLSNECLIDYANYNAELNMFLLARLFSYLQDNCDHPIQFKVMMTIRNQKDSLKSLYAYDYTHLKERFSSFEKFIEYGLKNQHEIVFGGYHYDLVLEDMKKIYGADNVRFFVYEKMKKDIRSYIQDILDYIGTSQKIEELDYTQATNVNSDDGVHRIRDVKRGIIALMILKIYQRNKRTIQRLEAMSIFKMIKKVTRSYCKRSMKVIDRGGLYSFPKELAENIDYMYKETNSRLSEMLNIDLSEYGYV